MNAYEGFLNNNSKRIVLLITAAIALIIHFMDLGSVEEYFPWAIYVLSAVLALWYILNGALSHEEIDPYAMVALMLIYVTFEGHLAVVGIVAIIMFVFDFIENDLHKDIITLVIAGVSLVLSLAMPDTFSADPAWIAIVICGAPIIWDAVTGLLLHHDIKADVLVAIAIIAALYLQEFFAAGEVALIMEIGGFL